MTFVSGAVTHARTVSAGTASVRAHFAGDGRCAITPSLFIDAERQALPPFAPTGLDVVEQLAFTLVDTRLDANETVQAVFEFKDPPGQCGRTRVLWRTATTVFVVRLPLPR